MNTGRTATGLVCNTSNGFDCNICLEFVQDPVVTLCGHLYCWPCIYKWIQANSISNEDSEQQPQCPVCKAEVSTSAVVPLYGRGKDIISSGQEVPDCGISIPERPSAPIQSRLQNPRQMLEPNYNPYYVPSTPVPRLRGINAFQPIIEIFGAMLVYSRVFGQPLIINSDGGHSDSYNLASAHMPLRVRRQLMHADQSLSRLCFFFFCCMILCLLLF